MLADDILKNMLENEGGVDFVVQKCRAYPEMLALLQDMLEWDGILPHSKTRIRAVIDKATTP